MAESHQAIIARSVRKLRRSAFAVSLISLLPHIFCCLLPTSAALLTLGTTVGLGAALASNPLYQLVDAYHRYFLGLAVFMVLVSGALNFTAQHIDCRDESHIQQGIGHETCAPKKTNAYRLFLLSCALLLFDIGYFLFEERILGLHHR